MKRLLLLLVALVGTSAYAQDLRGSISGQVTDPSGAAVLNATVTVTNTDTGAVTVVKTRQQGLYTASALLPGAYSVAVDSSGFTSYFQFGIHLQTQQNATVNVKLQIGSVNQVVKVTEEAPMIDTQDASQGQVLSEQEVQDLPSDGRSPLGFARIEYGAVSKGKHALEGASPISNSTVSDFSLGGGNSASNEYLLNGVPNMQDSGRTAAYSPNMDAVDAVRVDVFGANVTYGDTSGGTVNITTKSGTNQFHGSLSEFYQAAGCSGQDGSFVSRSANHCDWMSALPWKSPVGNAASPATHENQFGGTIGGPIWIPHVFNGHNKLFFFYAYEGYVGQQPPAQTIGTVPTQAERNGDFSALLNLGPAYQLYNPNSATGTQSSYTRTAIPGNVLSNAGLTISPIAQAYLKMVPMPNYNGPTTKADGENNYFTFTPTVQDYRSHQGRIDWNISDKDKLFGEAHRSRYLNSASNYFHNSLTGTNSDQMMFGTVVEEVHSFTPSTTLDVRGSLSRYDNYNDVSSSGLSPTSLGFPGYLASNATTLALPLIQFSDATNPLSYSNAPGSREDFDTIQFFGTLTKLYKTHTFMVGTDLRSYKYSSLSPGDADGQFSFGRSNGGPVTAGSGAAEQPFGAAFALFMLGVPTGGQQNVTPAFQYNSFLHAFFFQDDWRPKPNLTISTGIRFEHEIPVNESQNRITVGFDPSTTNEATGPAEANYAKNPANPAGFAQSAFPLAYNLPINFSATGGAVYASSNNRHPYQPAPVYYSPRIGMSWAPSFLNQKGVVRLGFGVYTNPFNDYNTSQTYGYSATTAYVQTSDNGITNGTVSDPFPTATNPIQQPTGNALGINTNLGAKMVYYSPQIQVPYSERASLDFQYQIGHTILVELGYIFNHQVHLSYSNAVDSIPLLPYLSRSQYYDTYVSDAMGGTTYTGGPPSTLITNPYKGVTGVTGSLASSKTLAPSTYLMSNSIYSSVTSQLNPGASSNYNALNARVAKTMGHGLTLNGVFEWSRLLGTFNQLNAGDSLTPGYGETTSDYPFHFSGYGTYQLPLGRGRQFFNQANRIVDGFIGGWQVSAIYQFLSGTPISWGNVIYTGSGWNDFQNKQHDTTAVINGTPVFNTAVFDTRTLANANEKAQPDPGKAAYNPAIQPNSYNYRTFPAYLLRQDYTSNWDANLQKDISTFERVKIQLRLDAFNVLNRPQYGTPTVSPTSTKNGVSTFGTVTGIYSGTQARQLQVGAHIVF